MSTETKATKLPASVKPGVVTGKALVDLLDHAQENGCEPRRSRARARSPAPPSTLRIAAGRILFPGARAARLLRKTGGSALLPAARAQLRHPGGERRLVVLHCRVPRGGREVRRPDDYPVLARRRPVHGGQGGEQRQRRRVRRGQRRGRALRAPDRRAVRRARHPPHGPLPALVAAVVRRPHGGERGLLQEERRAALLVAHARPLGGAARGERRDVQGVPRAHEQVRLHARDGARRDRRRGGRRRQLRRRRVEAVHAARGGARAREETRREAARTCALELKHI